MAQLAREYMQAMKIQDTQYIVVRHTDTEHPHCHILYNRVKYDTKLVPDSNECRRNTAVCKVLKLKYGLTFSQGKEHIHTARLHGADRTRQEIYEALHDLLGVCTNGSQLVKELRKRGIVMTLVHRGNDVEKEIQGATFTKDGITFKASQIDRNYSFAKIVKRITENAERQRPPLITEIKGCRLTHDQQRRVYSLEGLTGTYSENGRQYHATFRVEQTAEQHILTEHNRWINAREEEELHVPSIPYKRRKGRKL